LNVTKIIITRCQIFHLKCTKFNFGWGSAPDPDGELTALPGPQLDFGKIEGKGEREGEGNEERKGKGQERKKGRDKGREGREREREMEREGRGRVRGRGEFAHVAEGIDAADTVFGEINSTHTSLAFTFHAVWRSLTNCHDEM